MQLDPGGVFLKRGAPLFLLQKFLKKGIDYLYIQIYNIIKQGANKRKER